jgi:hypothetical protein
MRLGHRIRYFSWNARRVPANTVLFPMVALFQSKLHGTSPER